MIYKLGNHILIHGSCMDAEEIDKAIEGKIRMICTDPPYGVAYVENKGHFKEKIGANLSNTTIIQGDQLQTDEEYATFTENWLKPIVKHMADYNTAYIFNSDLMMCALRTGFKRAGFYYSQMIIWVKNQVVLGRKDYLPQHEIILYGWYGRHKMERSKGKSVMFHPKPSRSKLHPTMKPVGLLRKLIMNSTKRGEWVYDPFLGSGSTLMACEDTQRRCIGIEIEPIHVKTIIARWEKLTEQKAVVINS